MAQPDPYARDYDFEGFQSGHPSTPLPADKVNDEFDAVDAVLDQVLARIALLQDDDLVLKRGSVGYDQLNAEVDIGFIPPTLWETATAYPVRSTVFANNNFYRCLAAHTSGTFSTDLAAGYWELVADFTGATTAAEAAQVAAEVAQAAAEAAQSSATASASAAVTSAANAATSASSAATSSSSASGFADDSLASAVAAAAARDAALASQTAAATAQTAAEVAQAAAEAAATLAATIPPRWVRVDVLDAAGGDPAAGYAAGGTIDGVTLQEGMQLLRATPGGDAGDGVYLVPASGAASRSALFDAYADLPGSGFRVVQGGTYANTEWRCVSAPGGTIDATAVEISEFNATPEAGSIGTTELADEAVTLAKVDAGSLFPSEIHLKWSGAVGDGVADDDVAFGAFLTAAVNASPEADAIVDSGTYRFSTPRQLLNPFGTLRGRGKAVLKYVGGATTNVLSLSDAAQNRYQQTVRDLTIQGNAGSQVLLYMDKVNHAIIENIDFRDAHPGNAALQTVFCVLGKFRDIRCSYAEAFAISTPLNGLSLGTGTSSATQTIACTFDSVIVEGVGGNGIILVNGWYNVFTGGTSEGNTGWGVRILDYSRCNIFNTMFFEANTLGDVWVQGHENIFMNCEATSAGAGSGSVFIDGGDYNRFIGGRYNAINIGAGSAATLLDGVTVDTVTDNGSATVIRNCYTSAGVRIPDKSPWVSIPLYTDATRPTPPSAEPAMIWNTTVNRPQVWDGLGWFSIAI